MEWSVVGNAEGRTVFVLAGWPDNANVFDSNIVKALKNTHRIVKVTLPGYSPKDCDPVAGDRFPTFGYNFEQLVSMLQDTVREAMAADDGPCRYERPILVIHDWGAVVGWELHLVAPRLFSRIVALDVAGKIAGGKGDSWTVAGLLFGDCLSKPWKEALGVVIYQFLLMLAFFNPLWMGDWLASNYYKLAKATPYDDAPGQPHRVTARMGYPYVQLWSRILTFNPLTTHRVYCSPTCPVLYMYGTKKPFQFQTQELLGDLMARTDGSKVVPVAGNHWFYSRQSSAGEAAVREIVNFVRAAGK